ncbi:DMT family transporter [Rhizobium sp. LjRoot98]|uniref:DMT family transporter n=1 Tax=unclassified Rhizobium TaxID=2613769 RepID=UPI0007154181|nr:MULTISPECIES: DMT family transporter [unclassified Rhizobium]KQV37220.1 multidrug DMT transporter permease [Rhizobium sp. Root1204]KQY17232.1 multidrug DMT transporter permease [Rhizobium sp. Root1334]KRC13122.1 multidrug DMT transporter permease [Rhizobium sp. Root73]
MDNSPSIAKAAAWMVTSVVLILLMAVSGRVITRELDVFQAMEMRSVIAFFMLLPLVYREGGIRAMRTGILPKHIGRNVAHYAGQYAWLMGLTLIPLAQVISIEFTAPIWAAFLAAIFLGERLTWRKGVVILFGLAGVALIVRPGAAPLNPGHLITLGAAFAFAISFISTKALTRSDSATKILFWMLVIQSIIGIIPAINVWLWPSASTWPWIFLFAFAGSFAHFCMAKALSHADATVVMPMDYLRVPLSAVLGFLLYSEAIDSFTAIGAGLILVGNLFNLRRPNAKKVEPTPT